VSSSGPSHADRDLAARLTSKGQDTSPWQVRRWRQDGYLKPERRGLGRGLGTTAFYSDESVQQATALAEAIGEYRRLDEAALVVFGRGFPIKERALKRAYASTFSRIQRVVRPVDGEDPWDTAYRAARVFSRRSSISPTATEWRKRLGELGRGEDFPLVLQDLIRFFFLGDAEEDEVLMPQVFEAMGLNDVVESLPGDDTDRLNDLLRTLNVPSLKRAVKRATLSELETAREDVGPFRGVLADDFLLVLIGIPAALVARPLLGGALAVALGQIGKEADDDTD
jgi:hypothetical protein